MLSDDVAVIAECIATAHQALEAMTNKFESQEKEIDYLKKNALAQEIKINDLKKKADEYKRHRLHPFPMRAAQGPASAMAMPRSQPLSPWE